MGPPRTSAMKKARPPLGSRATQQVCFGGGGFPPYARNFRTASNLLTEDTPLGGRHLHQTRFTYFHWTTSSLSVFTVGKTQLARFHEPPEPVETAVTF